MKQSELSRLAGVSRQAIHDAIKHGALILIDGQLDPEDPKTKAYLKNSPMRRIVAKQEKTRRPKEPIEPKKKTSIEKTETRPVLTPIAPPTPRREYPRGETGETFDEAQLREKIERADKLALENKQKRGELIQVTLLHSFLSRLYAIDTSQFLTRGDRIAATVAGAARAAASDDEANVRVNDLLMTDAYTEQAFKKKLIQDFLKTLKLKDDITK